MALMEFSKIKVGERVRNRLGNVDALKQSIETVGLLQPLVLDGDSTLVSGWRRLQAMKQLGRKSAEVVIIESLSDARLHLIAERDENTCREDMDGAELMSLARALLAVETPRAKERKVEGGKQHHRGAPKKGPETVSEPKPDDEGKALAHVGSAIGLSAPSTRKGIAVLEAVEAHPKKYERAGELLREQKWSAAARAIADVDEPKRELDDEEMIDREMSAIRDRVEALIVRHPRKKARIVSGFCSLASMFKRSLE